MDRSLSRGSSARALSHFPGASVTASPFWTYRPTFVTGGTGLVGSWLVRRLVDLGADVVCLVRDWVPASELLAGTTTDGSAKLAGKVRIVRGDIRDQALMERVLGEYEIDTVVHLAAQTIVGIANRNPISTFETNIQGTWSVLEACRRSPKVKQIVVASSDKAYGDCDTLPYDESTPLDGINPYDVSKSCSDLLTRSYAKSFGLPVVTTRCGNFYGGGDLNWNRIVPGTIRSVLNGERPVIRSDGTFIRDYFYVEDGAYAYTLLAEELAKNPELRGEAYNFSNEIQVDVLSLVKKIGQALGRDIDPDVRNEASNEIRHQYLSAEKARKAFNWKPLFTLEEGLARTATWYKQHLESSKRSS